MKLVSVPESVLVDLIWNAELLSVNMENDAVERQAAVLRSYMSEDAFNPHGTERPKRSCEVIDLFTGKNR